MSTTIIARARGLFARPGEPVKEPAVAPKKATNAYHAVTVAPGPQCCVQASQLRDKRFLSREAPTLPLEGCTRGGECSCRYEHHEDRRKGSRRARDAGVAVDGYYETEQRTPKRGHRKSDR